MTAFCNNCNSPLLGGSALCPTCGYDNTLGAVQRRPAPGEQPPAAERPRPVHHEHHDFAGITPQEDSRWSGRVVIGVIVLALIIIGGYGFWSWNKSRLAATIAWTSPPTGAQGQPAGGLDFSCVVTEAGKVMCWGNSDAGQLGDTAAVLTAEPLTLNAPGRFTEVEAGDGHACARTDAGDVLCWGSNTRGQLGVTTSTVCKTDHGQVACSVLPVTAPVSHVRELAAGGAHTCALQADSSVTCWGSNLRGQLGTTDTQKPGEILVAHVDKRFHFIALAAGGSHTCGIQPDGTLMCWGWDRYGELGAPANQRLNICMNAGAGTPCAAGPVPAAQGIRFMQVALGRDHSCGLSRDGVAYCWGANGRGQVGNGHTADSVMAPTEVIGGRRYVAVGTGQDFSCGIARGGAVWCWGDAAYHQLGTADSTFNATPVQVPLTQPAISLGVGGDHACVVIVTKQVICWGADAQGQTGKGVVGLGDTRLREAGPSGAGKPLVIPPSTPMQPKS